MPAILNITDVPCGSGLAREGVRSVDIDAECAGLFVSKPTPTLDFDQPQILHPPPIPCDFGQPQIVHSAAIPCGSGLARESVSSVDTDAECTGLFVSKPTPTLDCGQPPILHPPPIPPWISASRKFFIQHQSPVGAGLLAKASAQSTLMLNVPAPS